MAEIDDLQKVLLLNAGANGAMVADFAAASNQYGALPTLKKLAPALTFIGLTINDSNAATAVAAYESTLALIVEGAMVSGDVVLELAPSGDDDAQADS